MADRVVIGVDPAATRVAFVALAENQALVRNYPKLGKSGAVASAAGMHRAQEFLAIIGTHFPGRVLHAFVEAPLVGVGGVRSTLVQCFTSGAIQAALHDGGCSVQTANVSTWKKQVLGYGRASKEDVAEHIRHRWPAIYREAAGSQDVCDAACIALYGQQLLQGVGEA